MHPHWPTASGDPQGCQCQRGRHPACGGTAPAAACAGPRLAYGCHRGAAAARTAVGPGCFAKPPPATRTCTARPHQPHTGAHDHGERYEWGRLQRAPAWSARRREWGARGAGGALCVAHHGSGPALSAAHAVVVGDRGTWCLDGITPVSLSAVGVLWGMFWGAGVERLGTCSNQVEASGGAPTAHHGGKTQEASLPSAPVA